MVGERILYKDIDDIDFMDYGDGTSKNYCEISIKTKLFSYPILGKKLRDNEFKEVFSLLQKKSKVSAPSLPEFKENEEPEVYEQNNISKNITGLIAFTAIIVSAFTIIGISISTPYSDIISGEKIFFSSFILSLSFIIIFCFFYKKKIK